MENKTKNVGRIVTPTKAPEETYKLFFGDTGNILRVDQIDYPAINNVFKKMFSEVWAWTAIDFSADITGWDNVDPIAQGIFLENNAYQMLMDSGVVNIYNYLALLSTNTELSLGYQYVAQNESIHAGSYSYGLSQMFGSQAQEKINIIYEDPFIQERMKDEADFSEELFDYVIKGNNKDAKAKGLIFKAVAAAYVLEHIKFPFSFYATWNINRVSDNSINGFSMLLKMIAQDELQGHTVLNANVLKILRREDRQGFQEVFDDQFIIEYIKRTVKQEKGWSKRLLRNGEIPGFTQSINENFIEYQADLACKKIGLPPIYNAVKNDNIEWFDIYRNIRNQNSSLQEVSNNAYNKGIIKNDIAANLERLKKLSICSEDK